MWLLFVRFSYKEASKRTKIFSIYHLKHERFIAIQRRRNPQIRQRINPLRLSWHNNQRRLFNGPVHYRVNNACEWRALRVNYWAGVSAKQLHVPQPCTRTTQPWHIAGKLHTSAGSKPRCAIDCHLCTQFCMAKAETSLSCGSYRNFYFSLL